jgi:hypothetical protein
MNPAVLIGGGLFVLGALAIVIGGIIFLVEAFKEHILWGLGSIFLPFVGLIFLCMHWNVAKRPFFIKLGGILAAGLGIGIIILANGRISF